MTHNTDKIAIETPEEQQAFGAIVASRLIDSTPNQFEQLTERKAKVVQRLAIELDAGELAKFGEHTIANVCGEIIKALNAGISREELINTLQGVINSSRNSAGFGDVK